MILAADEIALHARGAGFVGEPLVIAVAVALAESGADTNAHATEEPGEPVDDDPTNDREDSRGLWQINIDPRTVWGRERADRYGADALFDPAVNAWAAFEISDHGTDWTPWSVYGSGAYIEHFDAANQGAATMADVSQNGWLVVPDYGHEDLASIPKIIGQVRKGDVAAIFTDLVLWFDRHVEDVDAGRDDWGYAKRSIAGSSTTYSNHASGTAIDINATQHPLGAENTFTAKQVAAIHDRLDHYQGAIRWGGDYSGRVDEMHFEINVSPGELTTIITDLGLGDDDMGILGLGLGDRGPRVELLQRVLERIDPGALPKWGADGDYGDETATALGDLIGASGQKNEVTPFAAEAVLAAHAAASQSDGYITVASGDKRYVRRGSTVTLP